MASKIQFEIEAGPQTEELAKFITSQLSDMELDQMELNRRLRTEDGLVSEPVTIAFSIVVTPTVLIAVSRMIGKWLEEREKTKRALAAEEARRQTQSLKILAQCDRAKLGPLLQLAEKFPAVEIDDEK